MNEESEEKQTGPLGEGLQSGDVTSESSTGSARARPKLRDLAKRIGPSRTRDWVWAVVGAALAGTMVMLLDDKLTITFAVSDSEYGGARINVSTSKYGAELYSVRPKGYEDEHGNYRYDEGTMVGYLNHDSPVIVTENIDVKQAENPNARNPGFFRVLVLNGPLKDTEGFVLSHHVKNPNAVD